MILETADFSKTAVTSIVMSLFTTAYVTATLSYDSDTNPTVRTRARRAKRMRTPFLSDIANLLPRIAGAEEGPDCIGIHPR